MFRAPDSDLDVGGFKAPESDLVEQPKSYPMLDVISQAVGQTPLGMAAKGMNSVSQGINKVLTPFIPAQTVQKVVTPIFRASRSAGVGAMRSLGRFPNAEDVSRSISAYQSDFKPQNFREEIGSNIGEMAPVIGATAASPLIGGPISMAAEQAYRTGKISPVPAALAVAGPATKYVAKPLFTKALSYAGDIPESSIAYKLENPLAIKNAKEISDIATSDVPRISNKFDQVISELMSESKKYLSKSPYLNDGAFTKDEVLGVISKTRKDLGGINTSQGNIAAKALSNLYKNVNRFRNTASQNQVHDLIIDLDREIPWKKVWKAPETLTMEDEAMISVRTKLDKLLKTKSEPYGELMKPVSDAIETRNEFLKNFKMDKIKGEGYKPSDATTNRLFGATNENRLATQRILRKTKDILGENLEPDIRASQVKADFEPETNRSFRGGEIGVRQSLGRPLVKKVTDIPIFSGKNRLDTSKIFRTLPITKAQEYLTRAKGNKNKAREMALNDGWRL